MSITWRELITADPRIMHGQACVRGTRIPVSVILGCLAEGLDESAIVEQYPSLTREAVRAAAGYGAALTTEEIEPIPQSEG
jgi:uncharacterized protein (DUF433 family)